MSTFPSWGDPQKKTVTLPFLWAEICLNTLSQLGRPALVRVFNPVIKSRLDCEKEKKMLNNCAITEVSYELFQCKMLHITYQETKTPLYLLSSSDCKTRVTNFSFDQIPMGSALLRQLLIFLRPFPHGVPYYDQGANFPTKFEQRSHTKVTISRVFLMEFGEKEVC